MDFGELQVALGATGVWDLVLVYKLASTNYSGQSFLENVYWYWYFSF